jgi:hypothetical protein
MTELSPFQSTGQVGYGCKTWIAREIEEAHFGGLHYVWFSHQLNPLPPTGLSSNPLEIYRVIDYAVKTDDFDHPKIKDLRASLRVAVHPERGKVVAFPEVGGLHHREDHQRAAGLAQIRRLLASPLRRAATRPERLDLSWSLRHWLRGFGELQE